LQGSNKEIKAKD